MTKSTNFLLLLTSLTVTLIGTSCAVKQEIYLEPNGSGQVDFNLSLAPYVTEVFDQIQPLLDSDSTQEVSNESPSQLLDTEAIREDFETRDGVTLLEINSDPSGRLDGKFEFDNLNTLLQNTSAESNGPQLLKYSSQNGISRLEVKINRDAVNSLLAANPSLNNPLMQSFGPDATERITNENEYLEMMEFALGTESRLGILESVLDLTVRVDGEIVSQDGGRITGSDSVVFRIPLLPVLMLKEELSYSVEYR